MAADTAQNPKIPNLQSHKTYIESSFHLYIDSDLIIVDLFRHLID